MSVLADGGYSTFSEPVWCTDLNVDDDGEARSRASKSVDHLAGDLARVAA